MQSSFAKGISDRRLESGASLDSEPGPGESCPPKRVAERQAFFETSRTSAPDRKPRKSDAKPDRLRRHKDEKTSKVNDPLIEGTEQDRDKQQLSSLVAAFSKPVSNDNHTDDDNSTYKLRETVSMMELRDPQRNSDLVARFSRPQGEAGKVSETGQGKEVNRSQSEQAQKVNKISVRPLIFRAPERTAPKTNESRNSIDVVDTDKVNKETSPSGNVRKTRNNRVQSRLVNRNRSAERKSESSSSDSGSPSTRYPRNRAEEAAGRNNESPIGNESAKTRKGVARRVPVRVRNRNRAQNSTSGSPSNASKSPHNQATAAASDSQQPRGAQSQRDAQADKSVKCYASTHNIQISSSPRKRASIRAPDYAEPDDRMRSGFQPDKKAQSSLNDVADETSRNEQEKPRDESRLTSQGIDIDSLDEDRLMIRDKQISSALDDDKKNIDVVKQNCANSFSYSERLSTNQRQLIASSDSDRGETVSRARKSFNHQSKNQQAEKKVDFFLSKQAAFGQVRSSREEVRRDRNVTSAIVTNNQVPQSQPLLVAKKVSASVWPKDEFTEKLLQSDGSVAEDIVPDMSNTFKERPRDLSYSGDMALQSAAKETNLNDSLDDAVAKFSSVAKSYSINDSTGSYYLNSNRDNNNSRGSHWRRVSDGNVPSYGKNRIQPTSIISGVNSAESEFVNSEVTSEDPPKNGFSNHSSLHDQISYENQALYAPRSISIRKSSVVSQSSALPQSKQNTERGNLEDFSARQNKESASKAHGFDSHSDPTARRRVNDDTSVSDEHCEDRENVDAEILEAVFNKLTFLQKHPNLSKPKTLTRLNSDSDLSDSSSDSSFSSIDEGRGRVNPTIASNMSRKSSVVGVSNGSIRNKTNLEQDFAERYNYTNESMHDSTADELENFNSPSNVFKPIHDKASPDSLSPIGNADRSSSAEYSLVNEEKKFNQILETLKSKEDQLTRRAGVRVNHSKSRSEPVENNALEQKLTTRGRRNGVVQKSIKRLESDVLPASTFNGVQARDLPATLPRTVPAHNYGDYLQKEQKSLDTRKCVIANLLEIEDSYVNSLRILVENYLRPLKQPMNQSVYEPAVVDDVIFQVSQLLQHHQQLSESIRERYESWNVDSKIGDLFIQAFKKDMLLKSYTNYIDNFNHTKDIINNAIDANPAFKQILEQSQRESRQGLADLMIKPIQRVPRYELIIKDLLKHTPSGHPDHEGLLEAKKDIHALAVEMNKGEKEVDLAEKNNRLLQEFEQIIEGYPEGFSVPKRKFLHQEICLEVKSASKKERSLWLFNDMLLCTTVKKNRGSSLRRSTMNLFSLFNGNINVDVTNKYKYLWKYALSELDASGTVGVQDQEKQLQVEDDLKLLQDMQLVADKLSSVHSELNVVLKDMREKLKLQVENSQPHSPQPSQANHHTATSLSSRLEIKAYGQLGIKLHQFEFINEESRNNFEKKLESARKSFLEPKTKWGPTFLKVILISKTRNGMQFSCASSNVATQPGVKEVWVCNTDGHVGQVCLLTVEADPQHTQCSTVCSAKICSIAQVPAWNPKLVPTSSLLKAISKTPLGSQPLLHRTSSSSDPVLTIMAFDESDESEEDRLSPHSTMSSVNSVSSHDLVGVGSDAHVNDATSGTRSSQNTMMHQLMGSGAYKKSKNGSTVHGSLEDLLGEEKESQLKEASGTMWIGTEEGKINVFSTSDPIRTSRQCAQLNHNASVQCILHHNEQVFVALSNGDLVIYQRDNVSGQWDFSNKKVISGTSSNTPITKMIIVNDNELWCGCQNEIRILNAKTHNLKYFFPVVNDRNKQVHCMTSLGFGVYIALDRDPLIKIFHAETRDFIGEIHIQQSVNNMLSSSDPIIRQHKVACLRITSLLVCKNSLWAGTSAGVVLTMPLPSVTPETTSLREQIEPLSLYSGHTGHVRFLTSVEVVDESVQPNKGVKKLPPKNRSTTSNSQSKTTTLVISGGDGYEDFDKYSPNEVAGKEDSTNHLLIWKC